MFSSKGLKGFGDRCLRLCLAGSLQGFLLLLLFLFDGAEGRIDDQFPVRQSLLHRIPDKVIDGRSLREADLGLGRVDIDIDLCPRKIQAQDHEGELVLHQEGLVSFLDSPGHDVVVDQSAVHIEDLTGAVASGDLGLPDPALKLHALLFVFALHLDQVRGDVPSEYGIDHILLAARSGG